MKVKAIKSFIGLVNMSAGDVKDIDSDEVINDLIGAGLVVAVEEKTEKKVEVKTEKKVEKKTETKKPAKKPARRKTTSKK